MILCIYAAVIAFAAVTPDFAAPAYALALLLTLIWAGKLFGAKSYPGSIHLTTRGRCVYCLRGGALLLFTA